MTDIERITKENPAPSEIGSYFEGWSWRKIDRLGMSVLVRAAQPEILPEVGVLQHRGIVVFVRLNISGVHRIERTDEANKQIPRMLDLLFDFLLVALLLRTGR